MNDDAFFAQKKNFNITATSWLMHDYLLCCLLVVMIMIVHYNYHSDAQTAPESVDKAGVLKRFKINRLN